VLLNADEIKMLDLIARLVNGDPTICTDSNKVIEESGLPEAEAEKYLSLKDWSILIVVKSPQMLITQ
jgi:hypothetical protein